MSKSDTPFLIVPKTTLQLTRLGSHPQTHSISICSESSTLDIPGHGPCCIYCWWEGLCSCSRGCGLLPHQHHEERWAVGQIRSTDLWNSGMYLFDNEIDREHSAPLTDFLYHRLYLDIRWPDFPSKGLAALCAAEFVCSCASYLEVCHSMKPAAAFDSLLQCNSQSDVNQMWKKNWFIIWFKVAHADTFQIMWPRCCLVQMKICQRNQTSTLHFSILEVQSVSCTNSRSSLHLLMALCRIKMIQPHFENLDKTFDVCCVVCLLFVVDSGMPQAFWKVS